MSKSAQQRVKDECEKELGFLGREKSSVADKKSQCQKDFDAQMDLLKKEEIRLAGLEDKLQEKLKLAQSALEANGNDEASNEQDSYEPKQSRAKKFNGKNDQGASNSNSNDQQWDQGNDSTSWDQNPGQDWGDGNAGGNDDWGQGGGQESQFKGGDEYGYLTKKQREKKSINKKDDWSNSNNWGDGGQNYNQGGNDWGNGEPGTGNKDQWGDQPDNKGSQWDYNADYNPRRKQNNDFYNKSKRSNNTQSANDQSTYDSEPTPAENGVENSQDNNSGGGSSWDYNPTESNRGNTGRDNRGPKAQGRSGGSQNNNEWGNAPQTDTSNGDNWGSAAQENNGDGGGGGGDSWGYNPQGTDSGGFANQDYNGGQSQGHQGYETPLNAVDREELKTVLLTASDKALDNVDYDAMNGTIFRTERSPGQLYVLFVDGMDAQNMIEQEMTVDGEPITISLRPASTVISRKHKAAIEAEGRRAIKISGLPNSISDAALRKTCSIFGPLHTVKTATNKSGGKTALIVYSDLLHAFRALPVLKERPEFENCDVQHSNTYSLASE